MGFLSGLLNPTTQSNEQNVITPEQVGTQYGQANNALAQQQQFLQQLQMQGGLGNQNVAFDMARQQALGQGPNPAMAQLANTTGANTANQAALMAGQRGAAGNAGMLARQAANTGAANQQMAAGQGAALQAQQQLAGQQQMGNIAQQQAGNLLAAHGQQLGGTQGLYGQTLGGMNAQNANAAAMERQRLQGQGGLLNAAGPALMQGASALGNGISGLFASAPSTITGAIGGMGSAIGAGGGQIAAGAGDALGSSGIGGAVTQAGPAAAMLAYKGGEIPAMASGGQVAGGPKSHIAKHLVHAKNTGQLPMPMNPSSPMPMKQGGPVPGQAPVKGDSIKNDNVQAMLSPGEVVIPRHVMQSSDPAGNAAKFVAAVLAKKGNHGKLKS
jgi:hypothetical protein